MESTDSYFDEGRNPRCARRNQGPTSTPVGPGYGALFSPSPEARVGGQGSASSARTREDERGNFEEAPDLTLGLQARTPAQETGQARRGSKRRGKQPFVEQEASPAQVAVIESYLQSLLAQIAS